MPNTRLVGAVVVGVVAVAGVSWTVVSRGGEGKPPPHEARSADSAPQRTSQSPNLLLAARTKGAPTAPITVYEVSDFQCPYCRQFWETTLPAIDREYIRTGKIRFTFLNLPLTQIHANAAAAHELAMCAARQDRFWPIHDLLYRNQQQWAGLQDPSRYLIGLADSAVIAHDSLSACFEQGSVRGLIQAEAEMNWRAGIRSTPSFVIEGAVLQGAAPIDVWRPILDSVYAEKTGPPTITKE